MLLTKMTRPCWHCAHFGRWITKPYEAAEGTFSVAVCGRDGSSVPRPEDGCSKFSREPGADDEDYCIDPSGRVRHAARG